MFALNCLLQVEQVSSESDDHDDDPLALALRSLRFFYSPQILFASFKVCPKSSRKGFKMLKINPFDLWINHICKEEHLLNLHWKFHAIGMSGSEDMRTYICVG